MTYKILTSKGVYNIKNYVDGNRIDVDYIIGHDEFDINELDFDTQHEILTFVRLIIDVEDSLQAYKSTGKFDQEALLLLHKRCTNFRLSKSSIEHFKNIDIDLYSIYAKLCVTILNTIIEDNQKLRIELPNSCADAQFRYYKGYLILEFIVA